MDALIIYGVSGSGKSTRAEEYKQSSANSAVRIERDILRKVVIPTFVEGGWKSYKFGGSEEYVVDALWKSMIFTQEDCQRDIIISDTLCKLNDRKNLLSLLKYLKYSTQFIRVDTPLEECIRRDSLRGNFSVGEAVIRGQWENLNKHKEHV